MKYTYFFLFFMLTFLACQNDPIPERVTFKSTPLDSVYQDLRPEVQEFSILNNQPNKIKATKGTEIFVPENSFVDAGGNPIKGEVEVKLIEAFSLEYFITSGLATQSNGQLLISNGMINIDASVGGETVALVEGKELTVSMPTMGNNMEGFQMFTGDGQNWELDSSMTLEDGLIAVPLELLYIFGNSELIQNLHLEDDLSYSFLERNGISLEDKKYDNTLIGTQAFRNRLNMIWWLSYNMSFIKNEGSYYETVEWKERVYNIDLWKVYFDNLEKPIEELDRMVEEKYTQYLHENEDNLGQFFGNLNKMKLKYEKKIKHPFNNYYHYPLVRDSHSVEGMLGALEYFKFTEKGKVESLKSYGVDLNSENAFEELKKRNVSQIEINQILAFNLRRNALIDQLKNAKQDVENYGLITKFYETTSFSVKKLGWINCDRFYNSPNAKEAKILASNSSKTDLNFIDFSLIFPKLNARLSASVNADGKYAFTSSGRYSKLPIGEKAIVTGISFQNDSIYYAAQEIVIEENMEVDLDLKLTSKEELRDELSKLLD